MDVPDLVIERGRPLFTKFTFFQLLLALLALSFILGVAVFVLSGATTNRGTTGAIEAENAKIMSAEKIRCEQFGAYASISTLRHEGLLTFRPVYNSVVYVPGKHCGTLVVGSPRVSIVDG